MTKKYESTEEYLKSSYKGEFLVFFRYFIEGYLIPRVKFEELMEVVKDFRSRENEEFVNGLLREANLLFEKKDWDFVKSFVKTHGKRGLSNDRPKIMIEVLIEGLS
ncbi:hypothetical protein GK047_24570 [Paenibacillus sp. SYP-B3998]|uniref:Uncharacterized protein n=1 Tax=Paenibacillus sp. SYP-B3998 TaxID=2678564 RepID=A0A6G4A3V8_9BACL|nr:hypothetical protein [Paenibacillus sp. SYP-B3998]NEW09153.1 hypothetical protein [Paenibacillus sp. SYP-B3998]